MGDGYDAYTVRCQWSCWQRWQAEREAAAVQQRDEMSRMVSALSQGLQHALPVRMEDALRREFANLSAGVGAVVAPAVRAAIASTPLPQVPPLCR